MKNQIPRSVSLIRVVIPLNRVNSSLPERTEHIAGIKETTTLEHTQEEYHYVP